MQNSIAQFEFIALHGHPEPPRENTIVIGRAGVRGNSVWLDAEHGRPFKLRSVTDCSDIKEGRWGYEEYRKLIGGDPVELVWEDQPMSAEGFKVIVLDVHLIDLHAIVTPVGGFNPDNQALLTCEWDLFSIATPTS
jgi:hypothetical protein